jgi:hypothetical protein
LEKKQMAKTELEIKPFEVRVATERLVCDDCGESIATGWPYAVNSDIRSAGTKFIVESKTQCFRICSSVNLALRKNAPRAFVIANDPKQAERPAPWFGYQENPEADVLVDLTCFWLPALKVATGYSRIVTRTNNGIISWFAEVPPELFVRSNWRPTGKSTDPSYQEWETINENGDPATARQYLEACGDALEGHWYLNLKVFRPTTAFNTVGKLLGTSAAIGQ